MWKLKLTRIRAKPGLEEKAIAAQYDAIAAAPLPPPRGDTEKASEVLRAVRAGKDAEVSPELFTELQRQMVEAERWRAETKKVAVQLKKARDEMGRKHQETATMRAQNVVFASDNKTKRDELRVARQEADEMRSQNSSIVAQASMLEDRVAKLQDELTLKTELAAMWRRTTEKGGGGADGGADAAALTWKLEAERSMAEGERWKAAARKAEEAARAKEEEALRLRMEMQAMRNRNEESGQKRERVDDQDSSQEDIRLALLSAQEDLNDKAREAQLLQSKVVRLEDAIKSLM